MKRLDLVTLFAIFLVLNIVDGFNTQYLVWLGGYDIEFNPIVRWLLIAAESTLILWLWKFIILLAVWAVSATCSIKTKYEPRWRRIMIGACGALLFVDIYSSILVYKTL